MNKKLIAVDENWKSIDGKYICPLCYGRFSKYGVSNRIKVSHYNIKAGTSGKVAWNKGLTKDTCEITLKASIALKKGMLVED